MELNFQLYLNLVSLNLSRHMSLVSSLLGRTVPQQWLSSLRACQNHPERWLTPRLKALLLVSDAGLLVQGLLFEFFAIESALSQMY